MFQYTANFGNGVSHQGSFQLTKYHTEQTLKQRPNVFVEFNCGGCGCGKTKTVLLGQLTQVKFYQQLGG